MKTITTTMILVCVFLTSNSYSQIFIDDLNLNEQDVSIIGVEINRRYVSHVSLKIDYGQEQEKRSLGTFLPWMDISDKPNGERLIFHSKIHVINHLESNGWKLLDINSEARGESNARTTYYFRKKE